MVLHVIVADPGGHWEARCRPSDQQQRCQLDRHQIAVFNWAFLSAIVYARHFQSIIVPSCIFSAPRIYRSSLQYIRWTAVPGGFFGTKPVASIG